MVPVGHTKKLSDTKKVAYRMEKRCEADKKKAKRGTVKGILADGGRGGEGGQGQR